MASPPDPRNKGRLFVSPDAPAGGGGPGYFRQATSTMSCHAHTAAPAHGSPAARRMTPQDHQRADTLRRAKCVYEALCKAQSRVGPAIKEETGCALDEALSGILPAVVIMVGALAASAALGGAVGAIIGALAGGVGAIPGAAAGAAAGAELGMLLLNALGIGFLAVYIVQHITKVFDLATQGVREAWDAPSSPMPTSAKIDHASRSLARAVAVFIRLILEGIVLYLLEKGTAVTAQRVAEVGAKLRASKLGVRLAEYVERNWKALVENPKLRRATGRGGAKKGSSVSSTSVKSEETVTATAAARGSMLDLDKLAKIEVEGIKAQRILPGTNGKVAVIGRTMGTDKLKGVIDYASEVKKAGYDVEIFNGDLIPLSAKEEIALLSEGGKKWLTDQELINTEMFEANRAWAEKLKKEGYTVVDVGDPHSRGFSVFYDMETKILF